MDRLEDFRNPEMHSRALLPFEAALVEGMTGEIRNKVTLFRSGDDDLDRHFPRIEQVRDSFGHSVTGRRDDGLGRVTDTNVTLRPGEEVTFECVAWDPDGLAPMWIMDEYSSTEEKAEGLQVVFCRTITEGDIGADFYVGFTLKSPRVHHRFNRHDGETAFRYRVLPGQPVSSPSS